jgi:serine protease Do
MKNKTYLMITVATAIVSSLATVAAVSYFGGRSVTFRSNNDGYARYASYTDEVMSGRATRNFMSSAPTNFTKAADAITASVVNIKALTGDPNNDGSDFGASSGSGVILFADGYIVTNRHVVEGATDIQVTLNDKRDFDAKIVGVDPSTDLAIIKIDASDLVPVRIGNSDSLRVGEWVLAVGNPFNLESTVTAGIISAKGRSINVLDDAYSIESFIQTDAAVNPGNSGGALVNTLGELVGINTAIITKSGRYEGYSFAIPVNLVMKVMRDLRQYGKVQRGFLGVFVEDLTAERMRALGLQSSQGVYIKSVEAGKAAAEAGLQVGDVVVAIKGNPVRTKAEMLENVALYRPGDPIEIEFYRGGKRYKTKVTLKNEANSTGLMLPEKPQAATGTASERIGITGLRGLSAQEMRKIGSRGVRVTNIQRNTIISATNMGVDFIITHINSVKIESIEQVNKTLEKLRGKVVIEGVYEGDANAFFYTFKK